MKGLVRNRARFGLDNVSIRASIGHGNVRS